jgi:hypothetical protein
MTNSRKLMVIGKLFEQDNQVRFALANCQAQQRKRPKTAGLLKVSKWVGR